MRGRSGIIALVLVAGAMLWPALINGRPAYFFDSTGYHSNGKAAFEIAAAAVERMMGTAALGAAGSDPAASSEGVVAIRAIAYAVFVYLGGWPDGQMALVAAVQALLLAAMLVVWWRRVAPGVGLAAVTLSGVALAAVTSAAWFACYIMPDVFTGIALLGFLVLMWPVRERLGAAPTAFVIAMIAFAFAAHASHVPILIGLALTATALTLWFGLRERKVPEFGRILTFIAPVVLGAGAVVAVSFIGFSEVSLVPKRLPLVLARSIDDGPARWHLEKHCATEKYVVCELFPEGIPGDFGEFLFGPDGVRARATPAQMEAIRREESIIVSRAAREYPLHQIGRAAESFGLQLIRFDLTDIRFDTRTVRAADGEVVLAPAQERTPLKPVFNLAIYLSFVAAAGYLVWLLPRLRRGEGAVLLMLAAGLLGNALVTAVFSGVAHRYQSRVIWVVPAVAIGFWLARRKPSEGAADS